MKIRTNILILVTGVVVVVLAIAGWRAWQGGQLMARQWPELQGGVYAEPVMKDGIKYLVPPNQVYDSGLGSEDRPALMDPEMVSIATADPKLADELSGIALSVDGQAYFYPFQVLNWHEVVNADFGDQKLAITYSALTGSAVVYDTDLQLKSSGKIYNNATLLTADTGNPLWNQTSGQVIVGDSVGERLDIYPSAVLTWEDWKVQYLNGLVLSTDTGYVRDYGRHPYASYETAPGVFFPLNYTHEHISPKDLVYRVDTPDSQGEPVVYMARYLPAQTDSGELLGTGDSQIPIVAFYDTEMMTVRVFKRIHDGQTLIFEQKGDVITDKDTNSRWSVTGVAVSGDLRGVALEEIPVTRHYAFAHFAMFPNSVVSGDELLPKEPDAQPEGDLLEIN